MPSRRLDVLSGHLLACPTEGSANKKPLRVHIVCGDIMIVTNRMSFDHDVQYANRKFLEWMDDYSLHQDRKLVGTFCSDYSNLDKWLKYADVLICYCSGPVADEENTKVLQKWLEDGGKMIGIHGTAGGFARRVNDADFKDALYPGEVHSKGNAPREYVKKDFHDTLGAFFMAHPPIHTFSVHCEEPEHPVLKGIPTDFDVADELYLIELQGDLKDYKVLLTTQYDICGVDMVRSNYAYLKGYPWDPTRKITELHELFNKNAPDKQSEMLVKRDPGTKNSGHPQIGGDRNKRVMAFERKVGKGAIFYTGLGHCTVSTPGKEGYKGSWGFPVFEQLVKNAIAWAASGP